MPASTRTIANELVITQAAVKQYLHTRVAGPLSAGGQREPGWR
jgi:predicted transcriptional regulator